MREANSFPETHIKRLKRGVAEGFVGPEYGTELALMLYRAEITRSQYEAAEDFVQARYAFLRVSEAKSLRAAQLESGLGSKEPDPDSEVGKRIAAREERIKRRYEELYRVVKGCGKVSCDAFMGLICENEAPNWELKFHAHQVFKALHEYRDRASRARRAKRRAA